MPGSASSMKALCSTTMTVLLWQASTTHAFLQPNSLIYTPAPVVPPPSSPCCMGRMRPAMAVYDMVGIDIETGGLFDPLGFSKDEASLFRRRAVELKHGRICMLAVVGIIVQTFWHLPDPVFSNPRPIGALLQVMEKRPEALLQILAFTGFVDLTVGKQDYIHKEPGQLGYFGEVWKPTDYDEYRRMELRELKHGRLAMISVMGMLIQEGVTKQGPIEQLMLGHILPFGDGQGYF